MALGSKLNAQLEAWRLKLSVNDFIIKLALAFGTGACRQWVLGGRPCVATEHVRCGCCVAIEAVCSAS